MKPFSYSATSIQAGRNKIQGKILAGIGGECAICLILKRLYLLKNSNNGESNKTD
jgi:hypothetical protein